MIDTWLFSNLENMELHEGDFDYLLGRGGMEDTIHDLRIKTWDSNKCVHGLSIEFVRMFGDKGERINGYMVIPFFSPSGEIVGIEARNVEKSVIDFRTGTANWSPIAVGINKYLEVIINNPRRVWVVEGIFDLFAIEWIIGPRDAVLSTLRANIGKSLARFMCRVGINDVHIAYDNDNAGISGSDISLKTLKKYGSGGRIVKYSSGYKDPGEVWDRGGSELLMDVFRKYTGARDV